MSAKHLDTNYLVRFLTKDTPSLAKVATKTIKENKKLYIPTIVLAETNFILKEHYRNKKKDICTVLTSLLKQPNVYSAKHNLLAINIYQVENLSFYDCLIIAETIDKKGELVTFDRKMLKVFKKYSK